MKRRVAFAGVALLALAACTAVPVPASAPATASRLTHNLGGAAQDQRGNARHRRPSAREPSSPSHGPAAPETEETSKKSHKALFTRRLDLRKLEARGAGGPNAEPAAETLKTATTFNNATWTGERRQQLLAFVRRRPAHRTATFEDCDARIIAQIQRGSGAEADGKLRDETMAVLLAAGLRFAAEEEKPWRVQIDFYPGELEDVDQWKTASVGHDYRTVDAPDGEGVMYVHAAGKLVATYRGRGGPPSPLNDIHHVADPTEPGSFKLGAPHVHVTNNWENSQIPWGAEIREQGDGYQFRTSSTGAWQWATPREGPTLKTPLEDDVFEDLPHFTRDGQTILLWTKNDFGPTAWQLVPSMNYVHTTPAAEAAFARGETATLTHSHGCIHIEPGERDEMVKRGYLRPDVSFVVHKWSEHVLPDMVRSDMTHGTGAAARQTSK